MSGASTALKITDYIVSRRRHTASDLTPAALDSLQRYLSEYFQNGADIAVARARAPLRLGLAGGGTDLSPYCDDFGGAVLNATISRFAYAFVARRDDDDLVLRSCDLGQEERLPAAPQVPTDSGLLLHRGVYNRMIGAFNNGRPIGLTVTTHADVPAGSGLGTSSAIVVALVDAFRAFFDLPLGRYDVARLAYEIERKDLRLPGGKQDQYAAAFGGVNFIEFLSNDRAIVNPLRVKQSHLDELEASMVTCFTGQSRVSEAIVREQSQNMTAHSPRAIEALHQLKVDAQQMKHALLTGDVEVLASILERSWLAKKATARDISNPLIEDLYACAMQNGALAGKVSGAGGGGFMMFVVPPEGRPRLINALRDHGGNAEAVHFTPLGCETWIKRQ
jgi:D-glycero-alpha-D-manno-heptose-7-phosphate kinase